MWKFFFWCCIRYFMVWFFVWYTDKSLFIFFVILKLAFAIFHHYFIFNQMIALQKLRKMFISSKKLFLFSRYSSLCISVFPSFSPCQPLLYRLIQHKSYGLWNHQLVKLKLNNTFCLISWEGKEVWHWSFLCW